MTGLERNCLTQEILELGNVAVTLVALFNYTRKVVNRDSDGGHVNLNAELDTNVALDACSRHRWITCQDSNNEPPFIF